MAALLVVIGLTSGFTPSTQARPQPSDVGVDAPADPPFEIGTVMNAQSFR
jgi:hypothetical protein